MLHSIVFGNAFVTNRFGAVGMLGESTVRSIARIGVDSLLVGQFNPLSGAIMLARGESKKLVSGLFPFLTFNQTPTH